MVLRYLNFGIDNKIYVVLVHRVPLVNCKQNWLYNLRGGGGSDITDFSTAN